MTGRLTRALDGFSTFDRFPSEHRIRASNALERCFKEIRRSNASVRGTIVVGRFATETSVLALVWAVIVRDTAKWRAVQMVMPTFRSI